MPWAASHLCSWNRESRNRGAPATPSVCSMRVGAVGLVEGLPQIHTKGTSEGLSVRSRAGRWEASRLQMEQRDG